MRSRARISLLGLLTASVVTLAAAIAPAAQAGFGVHLWEAGTCATTGPTCTYENVEKKHSDAYTQAAGHPSWGITTFELNHEGAFPLAKPEGSPLKRIRVDVPPGLASNPQAPLNPETHKKCLIAEFEASKCPAGTEVGTDEATVFVGALDVEAKGKVYNLESSQYIRHGDGASGAHSDITGPEVAHAIWEAAFASVGA